MTDKFFYLKGNRTYIHSSNIFDSILSELALNNPRNIDFSISRTFANKWCLKNEIGEFEKSKIIGTYKDDRSSYFILDEEVPVTKRCDYDENYIVNRLRFFDKSVIVPDGILYYSFIEKINGAFKALLQMKIINNHSRSYLFVRLILKSIPRDGFMVLYRRKVANAFLEGEIFAKDQKIGFIYFKGNDNK